MCRNCINAKYKLTGVKEKKEKIIKNCGKISLNVNSD